jgi:acylphosphatase
MKKRLSVHFEGQVQGVGFRQGTRRVATGYEVAGTVRNLPDGRVELVVEGEEAELRAFLEGIADSHLAGHIRRQDEAWAEAQGGLKSFVIAE